MMPSLTPGMTSSRTELPSVGDASGLEPDPRIYPEELQLAFRNHSLVLEGLRYDRTPTGMHYTLTHYDVPYVDVATWQLSVGGLVDRSLSLNLADLQRRSTRTLRMTMQCAGDGRGLLRMSGAQEVLFTGLDRGIEADVEQDYQRSLPLGEALRDDVLLAWSMNDAPLEPQHGAPVRLLVPGWYGMAHVKWLRSIEVLAEPYTGYQNARAYRYSQTREEAGEPVSLMRVRSLMIPPGIPDFLSRTRLVRRGPVELRGRAWSGRSAIVRVEVSTNGGAAWHAAELEPPSSMHAWQSWSFEWHATQPGMHELCCRATDAAGECQPTEAYWTARGMGNNEVHRVQVIVD